MTSEHKECPNCHGVGARRCSRATSYDSCDDGYDCNRDGVFIDGDAFRQSGVCYWTCRKCGGEGRIRVELAPLEQLAKEAE